MNHLSHFKSPHLGLGCWAFGGSQWNGQSDDDSLDVLQVSFDAGIRHFDTAAAYGGGYSETIVGRFIADKRDDIFLATKGNVWGQPDPDVLIESLEASLRRLDTDYVDLFYIHWPNSKGDMRPLIEALEAERSKGRLRAIGVSNFSAGQIAQCCEAGTIDAMQHGYSLVWRRDEVEVMPYCRDNKIPLVTYSSLGQGILTGKFPKEPKFEGDDVRKDTVLFEPEVWPHIYEAVESMKAVAQEAGRPLAHLAIQWTLNQPGVQTTLVGARNARQAKQNAEAVQAPVDASVLAQLTEISDGLKAKLPPASNIFRLDV